MRLLGRNRLQALYGLDDPTDKWLVGWTSEILHASWKVPADVQRQFPNAAPCGVDNTFLFPVATRQYRIKIAVAFPSGIVLVTDLENWIHTH